MRSYKKSSKIIKNRCQKGGVPHGWIPPLADTPTGGKSRLKGVWEGWGGWRGWKPFKGWRGEVINLGPLGWSSPSTRATLEPFSTPSTPSSPFKLKTEVKRGVNWGAIGGYVIKKGWNLKGLKGFKGFRGLKGLKGLKGLNGLCGPVGAVGLPWGEG